MLSSGLDHFQAFLIRKLIRLKLVIHDDYMYLPFLAREHSDDLDYILLAYLMNDLKRYSFPYCYGESIFLILAFMYFTLTKLLDIFEAIELELRVFTSDLSKTYDLHIWFIGGTNYIIDLTFHRSLMSKTRADHVNHRILFILVVKLELLISLIRAFQLVKL